VLWYASITGPTRLGRITAAGVDDVLLPDLTRAWAAAGGVDEALWFSADDRVGRLAADGSIATYSVAADGWAEPLVAGPDGTVWFGLNGGIGSLDPQVRCDATRARWTPGPRLSRWDRTARCVREL
jgi:streptogramin lyase